MGKLLGELKRRKVFRVAAVYAVVAWLLIQVADTLTPALQLPQWTVSLVTVLLLLGFAPTIIAAWAYNITPDGIKPDQNLPVTSSSQGSSSQTINYIILIVVLGVAGIQVFDRFVGSGPQTTAQIETGSLGASPRLSARYHLNLGPLTRRPPNLGNFIAYFEFSPDGEVLVFTSYNGENYQLNAREKGQFESTVLVEHSTFIDGPRYSPDGRRLAHLRSSGALDILNLADGLQQQGPANVAINAYSWLDNNHILYLHNSEYRVYRYALDTQQSEVLFDGLELRFFQSPVQIPETDAFIFTANKDNSRTFPGEPVVMAISLETQDRKLLIENAYDARLIGSNTLVFMRGDDLWGVSFDPVSVEIAGTPTLLVAGIENESYYDIGSFAVSSQGTLVYLPGSNVSLPAQRALTWRDRNGNEEAIDLSPGAYDEIALSPSAQRIALTMDTDEESDIWVYDFNLPGVLNKVTDLGDAETPLWSLDSNSLYFNRTSETADAYGIWQVSASGVGGATRVIPGESMLYPRHTGPGGELLVQSGRTVEADILFSNPASDNAALNPLVATEYGEAVPNLSPDGRLVAYVSYETGVGEVYVRPYPNVDANRWRVSTNGGDEPRWESDNRLHYMTYNHQTTLVTLDIEYGTDFRVQERHEAVLNYHYWGGWPSYGVDIANERLLFMQSIDDRNSQDWGDGQQPVIANVINNFFAEIENTLQ